MCVEVGHPIYRFLVLFFNCLLTFGSYYCFDMPSVLQDAMEKDYKCDNTTNSSCCTDCLGMTSEQYNYLYAIYSWTNAFVVIGAGFFIDKFGNRIGAFLFSSFCVIGSCLFALGATYRGTAAMIPVMLLGRLIFGAGNGSLTIVQNRITSFWFAGKELALAFGITLAFSRLGSVLNFFLTGHLSDAVGLKYTLWIGAGLCGLGFISAIIVGMLDVYGFKRLGMMDSISSQSKLVRVSDVKHFSMSYWLVIFTIMFFYNGVFPFVADASKFIKDKYHYDDNTAAYMAGAVYDVSLILSPFLGGLIDVFGKRGILCILCSVLTIPVFGLLAFTTVHPLVSTIWLGITYSVAAASMWPSIPLVVNQATIGTAMGIATSLQMIGVGFSNLIVGEILGSKDKLPEETILNHWKYVMIYLLCNTLACVGTSIALNINDSRKGGVLNLSRKQAREKIENESSLNSDVKALVDCAETADERDN
ncbi:major facilitator superfamily domain-containing protein 1-like [Uloborus diversus]|uniref:major facilitator superfamily domain-containing protein 1-like n=1 Tax=Uloborus diversus TaxID=327109 RepID=UPI002409667A|nr:major facilitator superfamily domain-containing protein 1-like [Uloborus diversus]